MVSISNMRPFSVLRRYKFKNVRSILDRKGILKEGDTWKYAYCINKHHEEVEGEDDESNDGEAIAYSGVRGATGALPRHGLIASWPSRAR